jgi:hypothetical protein
MTRFTLFFDPGRLKQGLVPRLEMGPALESGRTYALIIDAAWQDEHHQPLAAVFTKRFRTRPLDTRQPDPARWQLTLPPAVTLNPLVVRFDEPLDHAMLQRVITVHSADATPLAGAIAITGHEQQWSFTPRNPWHPGTYRLRIESTLEDAAGNSIGRPFEVNLQQSPSTATTAPAVVEVPFTIR